MPLAHKVRLEIISLILWTKLTDRILGGSIAKLLLQYPEEYEVRCLTRTPTSKKAQDLAKLGAHLVQGNLTIHSTLEAAMAGVWGVWGVTDFYDTVRNNSCVYYPQRCIEGSGGLC